MKLKYSSKLIKFILTIHALIKIKFHMRVNTQLTKTEKIILKAVLATIEDDFMQIEKDEIQIIEKKRLNLYKNNDEILTTDYGAGSGSMLRSKQEMSNGVKVFKRVSQISRASKSFFWSKLIFSLIRNLKPDKSIELGTCVGISATYIGTAKKINGNGKLKTLEGCPNIASIAQETINNSNLTNVEIVVGKFDDTFLNEASKMSPIQFLFNDGHHDKEAVLKNFDIAFKFFSKNAVIIFDDINWSKGMKEAWKIIKSDNRVASTFNLRNIGIAILGDTKKSHINIPLI